VTTDEPRWDPTQRGDVIELFETLSATEPDGPEHRRARDRLVEIHLPLVRYLARKFVGRGVPMDDLVQVGSVGLIKAVDRFDPTLGYEFVTYAAPTVIGEIRRHLRDAGWLLRVPRAAQELQSAVTEARAQLSQELGRAPTIAELAARVNVSTEQVAETLDVARTQAGVPLDALIEPETAGRAQQAIALHDDNFEQAELRTMLEPAMKVLSDQERQVVGLRFVGGKTQTEIAELIGVSQMQVSRLLARSLVRMRDVLSA
jgi:RNA polymerase sigma-B factor